MVGAQRLGEAMAHVQVADQHCVVEVEEQRLEGGRGRGGKREDHITAQALIHWHLAHIINPG
jgi:hypothetical protein